MHRLPFQTPPQWWSSCMTPWLVRLLRPIRRRRLRKLSRIMQVEVRGDGPLKQLIADKAGILITPNHPGDGDVDTIYEVADRLGRPFHFMAAWQVFVENSGIARWVMRRHGTFSVDREGTDIRAFKHAVEILQNHHCPLVIYPEGEVYYLNDRVMPFLEGPAAMAISAAGKAERPVYIVPCAVKFFYTTDPTPGLTQAMNELEAAFFWRTQRESVSLPERIYRFAEAPLALKELEFMGQTSTGPLMERIPALMESVLSRVEQRHAIQSASGQKLPGRLKRVRQKAISAKEAATDDAARGEFADDLDDLFLVAQLYSYPGNYIVERPSVERIADTIKKFEEDLLRRNRPAPHGERRAVVAFGEPIPMPRERSKGLTEQITAQLEETVQGLLDGINSERA